VVENTPVAAKPKVVDVGETIDGTIGELRARIGRWASRSNILPLDAKPGDEVRFAEIKWSLDAVGDRNGDPTYKLTRLQELRQ